MNQLRKVLDSIQQQISRLSSTHKVLIGSLVVVMLMALFLVYQYAAKPDMVELLPGSPAEQQQEVARFLQANHVPHELSSTGRVMVAPAQQSLVLAQMSQQGALPDDNSVAFNNLAQMQSWTRSRAQNEQLMIMAVQNELSRIIAKMNGIRSASVIMDIPEQRTLGQPRRAPTASVTVFPTSRVSQETIDAIAHLVASSRAGLSIDRVRVIDGESKRQYRARDESGPAASNYFELVSSIEDRKKQQIYDMLAAYIRGVIVTVHAQVDNTSRTRQVKTVAPEGKGSATLLIGESTSAMEQREARSGGEPGVRSNTGADIAGASATTGGMSETQEETTFTAEFGGQNEQIVDPRGYPTKINAVVNIPRPYFAEIWTHRQGGEQATPPTDDDLAGIITEETNRIREEVRKLIDTSSSDSAETGEVEVSMIPTVPDFGMEEAGTNTAGFLGLPADMAVGGLVKTIALAGLALFALALMTMSVMKANKHEQLPSADELVGVPPALDGDVDIVGEASEADAPLTGIELSDEELRTKKMMEQVTEMVKERPEDASRILGKWIGSQE